MRTPDLREIIVQDIRIIGLCEVGNWYSHDERTEDDVLNTFYRRIQDDDSRRSRTGHKSLRCECDSDSALGLTQNVRASHVAEVKLVHHGVANRLGVPNVHKLRASKGQSIEARD